MEGVTLLLQLMKLRVLMCPEYFYPQVGGGEVWFWQVARHLVKRGHEVHILTYKHPGYTTDNVIEGIHIHRLGPFPIRGVQPYFRRALIQGIGIILYGLRIEFDIIQASQTLPLIPAKILSILKKRPIVAVYHDVYGYHFSLRDKGVIKGLIRGSLEKMTLNQEYNGVIAVSNSTKSKLVNYGVSRNKLHVIYEGVDLEYIDSINSDKKSRLLILYVGRLVAHKCIEDLLDSFKIVQKKIQLARLMIVGTGPRRQELEAYSSQLGIEECIQFTGYVSDKKKYQLMKQADVLVLPSVMEGFGLVLIEAMACGTPVIAVDLGGPKEVVSDNKTGFLVSPRQPKEIAEMILIILRNHELRQVMSKDARLRVEDFFTWEKTSERIESLYYKVVARARGST